MRLIFASFAAILLLGACSGGSQEAETSTSGSAPKGSNAISAVDNEFDPTELELTAGEEVTVTFTNDGETIHTFTSEELGFDTGNVDPGSSAEVTFTAPDQDTGFVCTLHEDSDDMVGTIVVN